MRENKIVTSRGLAVGLSLLALATSAFAERNAASEVGRWLGFAHAGATTTANPTVVMTLKGSPTVNAFALQGTISGLPAVQGVLIAIGSVSADGHLLLYLRRTTDGPNIGYCDGSVRPVEGFGPGSGQDDLGSLNFSIQATAETVVSGHMNMLHMFGGDRWTTAGLDWSHHGGLPTQGHSDGAYLAAHADVATRSSIYAFQSGGPTSSSIYGHVELVPAVQVPAVQFQMVGTANGHGGVIILCDGSVRTGDNNALIGLLFTGAIPMNEGPPNLIGLAGIGGFTELVPAVQKVREAAMSFRWTAGG